MSTVIRPEITEKSKYWISKHRFYELRHFCMQYQEWQREASLIISTASANVSTPVTGKRNSWVDSLTEEQAMRLEELDSKMELVRSTAYVADPILGEYIFEGVTTGKSYASMNAKYDIPCSKDYYYDRFRKFFYLLSLAK